MVEVPDTPVAKITEKSSYAEVTVVDVGTTFQFRERTSTDQTSSVLSGHHLVIPLGGDPVLPLKQVIPATTRIVLVPRGGTLCKTFCAPVPVSTIRPDPLRSLVALRADLHKPESELPVGH